MSRQRLPNRRGHELVAFSYRGISYRAGLGRYDDGRLAEIFLSPAGLSGSQIEAMANDLAIVASLALQHGCSVERLRKSLTEVSGLSDGSPLGALLSRLARDERGL